MKTQTKINQINKRTNGNDVHTVWKMCNVAPEKVDNENVNFRIF